LGGPVADHALAREAGEQSGDGRHVGEAGRPHLDRLFCSRLLGIRIIDDLPVGTALAHGCPLDARATALPLRWTDHKRATSRRIREAASFELHDAMSAAAPAYEYQ